MGELSTSVNPDVVSQLGSELEVSRREVTTSWAHYLSYPFYPPVKSCSPNKSRRSSLASSSRATGTSSDCIT